MLQHCPLVITHDFSRDRDAGRKWTVNSDQTNLGAVYPEDVVPPCCSSSKSIIIINKFRITYMVDL